MRILLPMVSLLVRAIVGSVEIQDSTLPSAVQPRNDSSKVVTTDNHTEMPSMDASKMWKRHSFREKRSRMAIDSRYVWSGELSPVLSLLTLYPSLSVCACDRCRDARQITMHAKQSFCFKTIQKKARISLTG